LLSVALVNAQSAQPYDVVIDEIMADPSPVVGLPNAEFIELKNVSAHSLNLHGWQLGDASNTAIITANISLAPDSYLIICSNNAASLFSNYGTAIGVSNFPSLNNKGDQLFLRSKEGRTIHSVSYSSSWYQNPAKTNGGWSLEMIDTHNPCSGLSNWAACTDPIGGTPGKKNSIDGINHDEQPPVLLYAYAIDNHSIQLVFDEPLDSVTSAAPLNFTISDGIDKPIAVIVNPPFFNLITLTINASLDIDKTYTVTVTNVSDCAGNSIGAYNKTKLGMASLPVADDIVINEILFNPRPDGTDYVELYNRSSKIINLKDCYLANRSTSNTINTPKQISKGSRLLFPGDYMVITEDAGIVKKQYLAKEPDAFVEIPSMPSLPNDKGDIIILNNQGIIIDELKYDEQWHFKLINNKEGVALERIDYNKPTQDPANWHSAATTVGYGTPTYQNSQFTMEPEAQGNISLSPEVFSPDNDGFDDIATILYEFPEPGYTCNITIFDAMGRPVRYLTHNALCASKGSFRWDGLDEKNNKLPVGVYVVYVEIFNLQGKTGKFKKALTLARKL